MKRQLVAPVSASIALALIAGCGGGDGSGDGMPTATVNRACAADSPCVSTVAGTGEMGNVDGPAASAQFSFPHAVTVDNDGAVHVADYGNNNLSRKISPDGLVSTPAGNDLPFPTPADTAIDAQGNRYVADRYNNRILKITAAGVSKVLVGRRACGAEDGPAALASFCLPSGLVLDVEGNLYVADTGNARIRKITLPDH